MFSCLITFSFHPSLTPELFFRCTAQLLEELLTYVIQAIRKVCLENISAHSTICTKKPMRKVVAQFACVVVKML